MKIAIVGHGFVGKATESGFKDSVEKLIIDKKYDSDISELSSFKADFIFVCVPTPMNDDQTQDSSIVEEVMQEITKYSAESIIILKSTILPNVLEELSNTNKKLIYNPEFLREKHADEDFINSKFIIFGGDKVSAKKASELYLKYSKCKTKDHIFLDLLGASFVKYTINTFLATKVLFFNQINELVTKSGCNSSWDDIINTIAKDERIGDSHMAVPGHDGRRGFGGACFPKDMSALYHYSKNISCEMTLLKDVIDANAKIRKEYKDLDDREKDQNISF